MQWFRRPRRRPQRASSATGTLRLVRRTAPYLLPRDDQEIQRLGFQHFALRQALRGNYAAPIGQPRALLDVGCGTGFWCVELARKFPRATVTGLDLNLPTLTSIPRNCTFVAGDLLAGLPFADHSFDFIHARLLIAAIPVHEWPRIMGEYMRLLRPGGWLEVVEGSPPRGTSAIDAISEWSVQFGLTRNIDMHIGSQIVSLFNRPFRASDTGKGCQFMEVRQRIVPIPIGPYGGRIGTMMMEDTIGAVRTIKPGIIQAGIVSQATFDEQEALLRPQFMETHRAVVNFSITYGQRAA